MSDFAGTTPESADFEGFSPAVLAAWFFEVGPNIAAASCLLIFSATVSMLGLGAVLAKLRPDIVDSLCDPGTAKSEAATVACGVAWVPTGGDGIM